MFRHNLIIRAGLQAYALTLPHLGFKCTRYEIKSRDMNEKGKEFIFYNKQYMPSAGLHGPLHMVCAMVYAGQQATIDHLPVWVYWQMVYCGLLTSIQSLKGDSTF